MTDFYIMDETGVVQPVPDWTTWAKWFEEANRQVAHDMLPGPIRVSTVFLGVDHNFLPGGEPLIFETMIFGGAHDQYQDRYSTREEALAGHAKAVKIAVLP